LVQHESANSRGVFSAISAVSTDLPGPFAYHGAEPDRKAERDGVILGEAGSSPIVRLA
jgi:hypothetical protein